MKGIKKQIDEAKKDMKWADNWLGRDLKAFTFPCSRRGFELRRNKATARLWYWMDMEELVNRREKCTKS